MDIVQLKKDIKTGNLSNFYIFTGTEIGVMNVYINKMGDVQRVDNVAQVWKKLTVKNLKNERNIYCIRDDKEFIKDESVWKACKEKIKYGTLILLFTDLDKRSKFYKHYSDDIVEFKPMTPTQLTKHLLSKGVSPIPLDKKKAEYLVKACEGNYTQTMLELNKLSNYTETERDFYKAVDLLVVSPKPYNSFSFMGNLLKGQVAAAIVQLDYLLKTGESSIMILGLMYTNFRNAAMVLGTSGNAQHIADVTGVNTWQVNTILSSCDFHQEECVRAMQIIQHVETGIKNGTYPETSAAMIATCLLI